jgi:hypothetical protein
MAKKWSDIRRKRFSDAEREHLDSRVRDELRDMNLSELRRELGITQEELARAVDVDQFRGSSGATITLSRLCVAAWKRSAAN